jgi:hypothetical protein
MNQPLLILALLAALSCCQATPAQERAAAVAQSTPGYSQLTISNEHGSVMVMHGPDDEVTVVRDGQVLSGDRVRREGDHLRILDEAGATIFDIRTLPGGGLVYPYDAEGRSWWGPSVTAWAMPGTPRKIIGVTVDAVDSALGSQLDLEPESAFVIATVSDGLPAEKAGLRPHDVVVKIQGETPATVERLREILDGKEPGDTIQLELVRRGQHMNVEVGVAEESVPEFYSGYGEAGEAYAELARSLSDDAYRQQAELEEANDRLTELHEELQQAEEALAEARSAPGNDADGRAELEQRRADVDKVRAELQAQQERLRSNAAEMQLLDLSGGGRALVLPRAYAGPTPPAMPSEVDDRLRSMEERLTRLEALLEKLVESDAAKK